MQDLHLAVAGMQVVDPQMRLVTGQRVEFVDADVLRDLQAPGAPTSSTEMTVSTPP